MEKVAFDTRMIFSAVCFSAKYGHIISEPISFN